MAIYKRDIASINLETGTIHRTFLNHSIGYKDQKADHFGIRVFRDGEPVDLTGVSVQGVFMPPQGDPIAITSGNIVSGNEAEVVLPQACYNYDGQFCLAIKLVDSNNSVTGTMRIVDGMVDNTHASGTVAPTSAVPTYQEILSTYDAMVAATAAANGAIAATYSSSSTYKVGDYCIHDGGLYRCTTAITTAEAWTSGHWTAAKIGPDVSDLKSALNNSTGCEYIDGWTNNKYIKLSGETAKVTTMTSNNTARCIAIPCSAGDIFTLNLTGGNASRAWAFVGAVDAQGEGTILSVANANVICKDLVKVAPANSAYLVLNDNRASSSDPWTRICYKNFPVYINYLKQNGIMITTESELSALTNGTKSVNDFPENTMVYIGSSGIGLTDFPTINTSGVGGYITFKTNYGTTGKMQLYIGSLGIASRVRTASWSEWKIIKNPEELYSAIDALKTETDKIKTEQAEVINVVFSSSTMQIDYPVKAGKKYRFSVDAGEITAGHINVYATGDADNYVALYDGDEKTFIPAVDATTLSVFKTSSTTFSGSGVNLKVTPPLYVDEGNVYYVGATRDHTSLVSLLLDIGKGNESEKTIYIDSGTYDIYSEYVAEIANGRITVPADNITSPDYFEPYNAFVPNNTRIIGLGNVVLQFTPTIAQYTEDGISTYYGASRTWSPLNIYGSVEIENITVIGKNCRYCLHNDDHNEYTGSRQHYKNCRFLYTYSDADSQDRRLGFNNTIGFGINKGSTHIFEDCEIYIDTPGNQSAYYGHDASGSSDGFLILKNCRIHTSNFGSTRGIRLQTLTHNSQGHVSVLFVNCYINGQMELASEYTDTKQSFEVTFSGCNKVPVLRSIASGGTIVDPYTVTWYNPLARPTEADTLIETNTYGG